MTDPFALDTDVRALIVLDYASHVVSWLGATLTGDIGDPGAETGKAVADIETRLRALSYTVRKRLENRFQSATGAEIDRAVERSVIEFFRTLRESISDGLRDAPLDALLSRGITVPYLKDYRNINNAQMARCRKVGELHKLLDRLLKELPHDLKHL